MFTSGSILTPTFFGQKQFKDFNNHLISISKVQYNTNVMTTNKYWSYIVRFQDRKSGTVHYSTFDYWELKKYFYSNTKV